MFGHSLTASRIFLKVALTMIAAIVVATPLSAATRAQNPTDRERALELYESNNFVAALPLLEKVAAANPQDSVVLSRLGFALFAASASEKDPAARSKMRERAKSALTRSVALGDESNLTRITLDALSSDDPTEIPFTKIKAAEAAIREGEAAFVRGDMDQAIQAYKRALELDPKLYDAALYAGDAEFKKGYNSTEPQFRSDHFDQAGIWFARAIAIDANRETAHRYWGDALDAQGKTDEARDRFVAAIVAEPYNRRAVMGLAQWAERHDVQVGHPRIDVPANVSSKPGEITITVDDMALKGTDDGSAAWMLYGIQRASWLNKKDGHLSDKFARSYPKETAYRHSLAEEVDALQGVVESVQVQVKDKKIKKLTPSLENLLRLQSAGLLEAYVLFARPDQGIAADYNSYRKANREKLTRYWIEIVIVK